MAVAAADFVHLHVHSEYSLLDGANRIGPLVKYVKEELGQPAVALTDHGVMFGAFDFYNKAQAAGVQPIIGCEVYITPNSRTARGAGEQKNTHHLLLLAENFAGYRNLMKLSSIGFTEGYYYKPRIDFEVLAKHTEGLIATSSCLAGLIPQSLVAREEKRAAEYCGKFVDLFGKERFFVEIQDHGIADQYTANEGVLKIAAAQGLRVVATNDCHYLRKDDADMHDVLLCIQTGSCVADKTRFKFDGNEFYVKSTEEMASLFRHVPESITNTRLVAEMCSGFALPKKEYHLPKFDCPGGATEKEHLKASVYAGAAMRYGARLDADAAIRDRIDFELDVILRMGFEGYFLIVADFIAWARSQGIPVGPGRGSAAGSVVAYCLRITELCPLEHGLLFERFLNPDRVSMPDIDIDFSDERRGEVIEYVRRKYGADCVAQIVTFGSMKAKAAVRDVGRALGMDLKQVDRIAKLIPEGPKTNLESALADSADLRQLVSTDGQIKRLYDYASRIEGMVRHASTHAAGVVISDRDLTDYIPLYKSPKEDSAATQYNMTEVEELGLLKMDFLGIKNLTIIKRVEDWLRERDGIEVDWNAINYIDERTFANLHRGQTAGVFQLESSGMTALVKALKPTEFADLTALLALYRPGPLQAGMHMMYVKRKHGEEQVRYDHPLLEPILKESYGIFLYQEQVMRVAMALCGFTRGEADVLRKAMGKKQKEVMDKMERKFVEGAAKHNAVRDDLAKHIWDQIVTFAGYGFNKSHSAAYAVITFQTAYLRAHYPAYFQAALLTNEISSSTDALAKYVTNAREVGLQVMPADINKSLSYFNPDGARVWYALGGVKGVGEKFVEAVIAERVKDGLFTSFQDFMMRVPAESMNSRMMEALIKVGAFDSMHANRAALLAALPGLQELAHQAQADTGPDIFALGDEEQGQFEEVAIPDVPDWDDKSRANYEKEFLGFYLSEHPLNRYRVELNSFNHVRSSQLDELVAQLEGNDSREINMFGCVTSVMLRTDKNGNPWAIVQMEDMEGTFEAKFFSKSYGTNRDLLDVDRVLQIRGRLSQWNNRASFDAIEARPAEELRQAAMGVEVEFDCNAMDDEALRSLKDLCMRHGGKRSLRLLLRHAQGFSTEFRLNGKLKLMLSDESLAALAALPGSPAVRFFS